MNNLGSQVIGQVWVSAHGDTFEVFFFSFLFARSDNKYPYLGICNSTVDVGQLSPPRQVDTPNIIRVQITTKKCTRMFFSDRRWFFLVLPRVHGACWTLIRLHRGSTATEVLMMQSNLKLRRTLCCLMIYLSEGLGLRYTAPKTFLISLYRWCLFFLLLFCQRRLAEKLAVRAYCKCTFHIDECKVNSAVTSVLEQSWVVYDKRPWAST